MIVFLLVFQASRDLKTRLKVRTVHVRNSFLMDETELGCGSYLPAKFLAFVNWHPSHGVSDALTCIYGRSVPYA
jgi:hypothetical protein